MTLYYPTSKEFVQTTLGAALETGVTASATLASTASTLGIQDANGVMIIDRVDANGNATPTKAECVSFEGTSGSTVTTLVRGLGGTTEQDHAVGAVVEFGPTAVWAQGLIDFFDAEHDTDGTHTDITADSIELGGAGVVADEILDEDDMASNDATALVSQQSVKAYVDSGTVTMTNKRITKRVGTSASAATHTIDSDSYDIYTVTAQAQAVTFAAPTGTPTNGQTLVIRLKDNGTARAITWNAAFRDGDVSLPTTTVLSQTMYLGFMWNSTDSKWDLLAVVDNVS